VEFIFINVHARLKLGSGLKENLTPWVSLPWLGKYFSHHNQGLPKRFRSTSTFFNNSATIFKLI